ncbi:metallophosphoesterase [Luteolibacter pohnpeiensis]|uniref:Metallophosphoesterase n=1 Tax=Luteolibacter pohnpeiensis TaxID=454153 RepID=A0A934VVD3_9BACT|nr:metallophosphoesterase [Luteolibacter pohnpeiensis]MBK1881678.1 metallophosphoesterase [Luteolibacter pohnpeiensis]
MKGKFPDSDTLPLKSYEEFDQMLDTFIQAERDGSIGDRKLWVGASPKAEFFKYESGFYQDKKFNFQPFAKKLILPVGSKVYIQGDLHGDIHSLLITLDELRKRKVLDGFKVIDPSAYLCFTGDFTDRGSYGVEVLYTLMRLKLANPERVQFARGNHEHFGMNAKYGFVKELQAKYGSDIDISKTMHLYDLLPVVIYLGTESDFVQMNHGGMEPGYDPKTLLASSGTTRYQFLGEIHQKTYSESHQGWLGDDPKVLNLAETRLKDFTPQGPTSPNLLGFMWSDFTVFGDEPSLGYGRSLIFGESSTAYLLKSFSTEKQKIHAVLRGHQHASGPNPLMNRIVASGGLFRHWQEQHEEGNADLTPKELERKIETSPVRSIPDGSVWTFNVSADSVYGEGCHYDFGTFGIMSLKKSFSDWTMEVVKYDVF